MPTLDTSNFSEEEMILISPLLDSKNRLSSNKPFRLSLDSEYIYHTLLTLFFRNKNFITPVPVDDRFLNPFSRVNDYAAYSKLNTHPELLKALSFKFVAHSFVKVY